MVEVGKAAHRTAPGDAASLRRQQRRPASVRSQPPKPDGALSGEGPDTSSSSRVLGLTEGQMPMPTSGGGLDLDIHPRAHLPLLGIFLSPHRRSPPSRHPHCRSPPPRQRLLLLLPPARLLAPERPNHASLLHGILICLCVLAALIAGPVAGRGALDPAGGGALGRRPPRRRLLDRPVHSQLLYRLMLRLYCSAGGQGHLRRRRWALLARRLMRLSAIGGWGLGLAAAASDGGRRKKERG
ncbi:uncharacterized protein [Triticum aestivum]|uniref:uncharacterized protein isoform X2 n=1 Tax=Triticum aestivum TaxID=4565 RepID=UPI001D03183B|nr:uncharacterized protein LOC123063121 isoform X2 [Triticum aestivum]